MTITAMMIQEKIQIPKIVVQIVTILRNKVGIKKEIVIVINISLTTTLLPKKKATKDLRKNGNKILEVKEKIATADHRE